MPPYSKRNFWKKRNDMGDNVWVNTHPKAYYIIIRVEKHPRKKEYAVIEQSNAGIYFMMNENSGTSEWFGMSKNKALDLALKSRKKHPK